jgi:hypothetical protein
MAPSITWTYHLFVILIPLGFLFSVIPAKAGIHTSRIEIACMNHKGAKNGFKNKKALPANCPAMNFLSIQKR